MESGELGKVFAHGEVIFRQGDEGDCMYVVQDGLVEITSEINGIEIQIAVRGEGEFFGEMAIIERATRMATARAFGRTRVLVIDKKNLLNRIHDDPSMAFNIIQMMSRRIRELSIEVSRLRFESGEL